MSRCLHKYDCVFLCNTLFIFLSMILAMVYLSFSNVSNLKACLTEIPHFYFLKIWYLYFNDYFASFFLHFYFFLNNYFFNNICFNVLIWGFIGSKLIFFAKLYFRIIKKFSSFLITKNRYNKDINLTKKD